jgi:hypothetical protein
MGCLLAVIKIMLIRERQYNYIVGHSEDETGGAAVRFLLDPAG